MATPPPQLDRNSLHIEILHNVYILLNGLEIDKNLVRFNVLVHTVC